ncbi:NTP pyrophosphohydrolase [Vibrio phage 1.031.O._10N.261.46.F8]|nr:NTP pyrophosphohydrolase [Vibrio phage 1.031.O._10N.261.46.F8]
MQTTNIEVSVLNYVQLAMRTNSTVVGTHPVHPDIIHSALGMADEILELQEAISKRDTPNIGEEIGDLCWFYALAGNDLAESNYLFFKPEEIRVDKTNPELGLGMAINTYVSHVKKAYAYGKSYQADARLKHLWMIWACLTEVAKKYNFTIEDIMQTNIEKLRIRFPDKFTTDAADSRNLDAERALLESAVISVQ